jgi:hypothetical protein
MTTEFISAYLINQKRLEDLIMNSLRTNETKRVGDLISSALLNAIGPNVTNNFAPPKGKNTFKIKVEGGDPVRSAERVPYSSSHQLHSDNSTLSCFDHPSTSLRTVAQHDQRAQDEIFSQGEKTKVAAA